ncbi:MAG: hypothetical protein ABSA11_11480 [Candidatus Bathyarchaeia archaeon]
MPTPRGGAFQAPAALPVLDEDYLAFEAVGVLQDPLDESPGDVSVCAAPVLPLRVDLQEDHIGSAD